MLGEAYIVEAVRTPVGRRGGALAQVHPADLGAHVLTALVERSGIDPSTVDDVIFGCVDQVGAQSLDIARTAWLSAGLPESVPGVTIDRQCGSSQQAAHFAAALVMSGIHDLVVAGGVEVMSSVPLGSSLTAGVSLGYGHAFGGEGWAKRYGDQTISQFVGAELIAEQWGLGRPELEDFALRSHRLAAEAWDDGRFDREVVAWNGFAADEGIRRGTTREQLAALQPLAEGGRLTAALASQISDGAAAVLVASAAAVARYGLVPRARFHSLSVVGSDPVLMLTGPIPATARALERGNLSIDEIDLFEINEAFAPVVLAWLRDTGAPLEKTNVNGGAIALGHPLGATGARLLTSLLHELERTGGRYGLQTMCEGGGQANGTIIERI
jgi:acetyl-CoA C-acetyltransferase